MARNGSGTWSRLYDWTARRDAGSPTNVIDATTMDEEFDDIATGLTNSLAKDGQTTPTANLPLGGFKLTGHSTSGPTARTDSISAGISQDNLHLFVAAGGTADALTSTFTPNVTALVNGMQLCVRAASANATTTPTFAAGSTTAKTIVKGANTALVAGDIAGQHHELELRYNSTTDKWHLLNPTFPATGRQTIWVPAASMTARTTNGAAEGLTETATNKVMIRTLNFDASTDEFAQFTIQMPKSWNEGTVTALFVWSHGSTTTNFGVVWGIQGVAISDDDTLEVAFGTAQTVTDTGGTTDDLYRTSEVSAVTIAGTPAENDVVIFQVYRDADNGSDTLAIDARLHGVALFITNNTLVD